MKHASRLLAVLTLLLAAAHAAPALGAPPRVDPYEGSVRQLRKAVTPQRDGLHMLLLSALRQLNDPTLRGLLDPLSLSTDPGVAVHSILGLGELEPVHEISATRIAAMKSIQARSVAIERALRSGLLHETTIRELLQQKELEPLARLWLIARLVADRLSVDQPTLAELAGHVDIDVAGFATWLLAETGNASAIAAWQQRVDKLPAPARRAHQREIFGAMGEYRLKTPAPWAAKVLSDSELDADLVYDGLHALLLVDLTSGLKLWRQHLGTSPTHSQSVRYALLLLLAGPDVPASEFDRLRGGEILLDRLIAAGKAISSRGDAAAALSALIDLNNALTARWALDATGKLAPDDAARVYTHLLSSLEGATRAQVERADLALEAVSKLYELKPEAVAQMLAGAADDSLTQEAILIGLLSSPSPQAGELAITVKRLGSSRADSLALILYAKHARELSPDDLRQLGLVAAGGGKVSDPLQAQAAWLYLRHTNSLDRALKEILPGA